MATTPTSLNPLRSGSQIEPWTDGTLAPEVCLNPLRSGSQIERTMRQTQIRESLNPLRSGSQIELSISGCPQKQQKS